MGGKRKPKEPFWKKMPPEITHFLDHLGHVIDNTKASDWADLLYMGGLAYLGYKTFNNPLGSLWGITSYKLATTMGGTPPVAQIAGLSGLAVLGIAYNAPGIVTAITEAVAAVENTPNVIREEIEELKEQSPTGELTPEQYMILRRKYPGLP